MSNRLIARIATVFGTPDHSTDPEAFIRELARLTKSYSEPELEKAADHLLSTFVPTQRKPWPTPAEICSACQDARELLNPPRPIPYRYPDWSPESISKAYKLIVSDVGRRAADEGWILSLWDFCRKNHRLPNASEQVTIKGHAHSFNEAFAKSSVARHHSTRCSKHLARRCFAAVTSSHAWRTEKSSTHDHLLPLRAARTSRRLRGQRMDKDRQPRRHLARAMVCPHDVGGYR